MVMLFSYRFLKQGECRGISNGFTNPAHYQWPCWLLLLCLQSCFYLTKYNFPQCLSIRRKQNESAIYPQLQGITVHGYFQMSSFGKGTGNVVCEWETRQLKWNFLPTFSCSLTLALQLLSEVRLFLRSGIRTLLLQEARGFPVVHWSSDRVCLCFWGQVI